MVVGFAIDILLRRTTTPPVKFLEPRLLPARGPESTDKGTGAGGFYTSDPPDSPYPQGPKAGDAPSRHAARPARHPPSPAPAPAPADTSVPPRYRPAPPSAPPNRPDRASRRRCRGPAP